MLLSHYNSSFGLVLTNLFKIFNKPLSKAMTDNVENKFCNIVDIYLYIFGRFIALLLKMFFHEIRNLLEQ